MKRYTSSIDDRITGRLKRCMQLCNVQNKRILDIGCSIGWFEKFAVENGCREIVAIDIDEKNLLDAKSQVKDDRIKFLRASALDLSQFENDYFDLIVMFDVIEHLPKNTEIDCIREVKRVIKRNGISILSMPNNHFLSKMLDPAWYFSHRHYSKDYIVKFLLKGGFKIEKIDYGGGFYELFSMILFYILKWIFKREIPFKDWFEKERNKEYLKSKKGFVTLFIKVEKK